MAPARPLAAILPLAFLTVAALLWAIWATIPPAAVSAAAPATGFSAVRAMATVRLMSRRPHPTGSPEAAEGRIALGRRLREIGLSVTSLRAVGAGFSSRGKATSAQAGRVDTLVATLPGRDRALPAIALMAHTDSVPGSFGAADDGFGTAVALETARALAAGPRPVRDVLLILTDGEEAGLLGARAFFADRARAARIGAIVNVDARGTSGLGTMFETGPASGGLVALYRTHARHRFAHSAATFLYHQLPNRTDLTATEGRGIPALNFAFLDGEFDYHTPRDRLASVDPRTLQSLGDQVLPVVQAVANGRDLPPRGGDGVFADVNGLVSLRYPAWVGWPLLFAAAVAAWWGLAGMSGALTARGTARAASLMLWIGAAGALFARLGYGLTGVGDDWGEHHRIMAHALRYEIALGLVAATCLAMAATAAQGRGRGQGQGQGQGQGRGRGRGWRWPAVVACGAAGVAALLLGQPPVPTALMAVAAVLLATGGFASPIGARDLRAGTIGVGLFVSLLVQIAAPPLTPLFLWPGLAAALSAGAARRVPSHRWLGALLAVVPLAYVLVFAHAVVLALGIPMPEAIGLFAMVGAVLILPLAVLPLGWPGAIMAGAAAILFLSFRWAPATERTPALSQIYAVRDEHGRDWRVSPLERPDRWTWAAMAQAGAQGGAPVSRASMPIVADDEVWRAPAGPATGPLVPPVVRIVAEGDATALTVAPANGGRELRLRLTIDRGATAVGVEGVALPGFMATPGVWRLRWTSSGEPVTLRFRIARGARLDMIAAETADGAMALPSRPATVVPWLNSDRMIVLREVRRIL